MRRKRYRKKYGILGDISGLRKVFKILILIYFSILRDVMRQENGRDDRI